ncbi:MAG: hypothetical protein ACI97A_004459 [Planctomycetota bacterium]|jgi:hypothetical protein
MKPIEVIVQADSGALTRGEQTKINVTLDVKKPLKARGIHAVFVGGTETKATYSTYNAATKSSQVQTTVQLAEVVRQEFLLSGHEKLGFFGNVADGLGTLFGGGKHDNLEPGQYDFEVNLDLPADAPGTFVGKKSRVYYELAVHVDIAMGLDVIQTSGFDLPIVQAEFESNPIMTRYPEDMKKGLLDSLFAPNLKIEAALLQDHFLRGSQVQGVFQIDSDKPLNCRSISARLLGIETTEANQHHDTVHHIGPLHPISESGVVDGSFRQDFSFPAEVDSPASTTGDLHAIHWFVQIEIDVPWAKDPKIRVPIVLLD